MSTSAADSTVWGKHIIFLIETETSNLETLNEIQNALDELIIEDDDTIVIRGNFLDLRFRNLSGMASITIATTTEEEALDLKILTSTTQFWVEAKRAGILKKYKVGNVSEIYPNLRTEVLGRRQAGRALDEYMAMF